MYSLSEMEFLRMYWTGIFFVSFQCNWWQESYQTVHCRIIVLARGQTFLEGWRAISSIKSRYYLGACLADSAFSCCLVCPLAGTRDFELHVAVRKLWNVYLKNSTLTVCVSMVKKPVWSWYVCLGCMYLQVRSPTLVCVCESLQVTLANPSSCMCMRLLSCTFWEVSTCAFLLCFLNTDHFYSGSYCMCTERWGGDTPVKHKCPRTVPGGTKQMVFFHN